MLGTGGHAAIVIDLARSGGLDVLGCIGPERPGFPESFCRYLGGDEVVGSLDRSKIAMAVGVGSLTNAALRIRLYEMASSSGFKLPPLVHGRSCIAGTATLGDGTQVMAGAVVQPFASVGRNAIVNTGAIVEHHVTVEDHVHIAPGAVVCGAATVGSEALVGAGAVVLQGRSVGAGAIVGAGAVVIADVPPHSVAKGVPAMTCSRTASLSRSRCGDE